MTALEENRAQLAKLQTRMKEYQVQLKAEPDSQKRAALKAKISTYRAAIRDVQVQIDHLDPPEVRKARKEQRRRLDIGALSFDFFERSGACWSDIEGHSWQQVEAGGSGCGCSASVLCAHILPELRRGELREVLFVATGALMSTTAVQQGESIPGIAHLVWLSNKRN